jgi:HK97 family phage major capsid protein
LTLGIGTSRERDCGERPRAICHIREICGKVPGGETLQPYGGHNMPDPGVDTVTELMRDIKRTHDEIMRADAERVRKIEAKADKAELAKLADDMARKSAQLQAAVEQLSLKLGRPGGGGNLDTGAVTLRQSARGLLELKHQSRTPKISPHDLPFNPTDAEIDEAEHAVKGLRHMMRCTNMDQLPAVEKSALSAFSFGASGFILQPELSNQILSCIVDPSDVTGLARSVTISGPSIKFMKDDVRLADAAWACDTTCYVNQPPGSLTEGLGEIEIKPEPIRYVVCATRDILEDASFDVESWMIQKVSRAFKNTVSNAIMTGDGIGKPLGILHPAAGIPICDTGAGTPVGQFTWQDLIMLKWQVPMQFQGGGKYLMNQNTFALILTMSDALGRPIMIAMPTDAGQFVINGTPIQIVTQMPDCVPGATPVAYGNWVLVYMIVNRKVFQMLMDPYSLGYCVQYRFEARIGGNIICSNAARLLRVK